MSEQSNPVSPCALGSQFSLPFAWSHAQFQLLVRLTGLNPSPCLTALQAVLLERVSPAESAATHLVSLAELQQQLERMQALEREIRQAFVIHPPTSFRVTVSHGDLHRMPGSFKLQVGDKVRLVAHTTERWITAAVLEVPQTPLEYFEGVIVETPGGGGRFRVGDRVQFGEDQVELPKTLKPVARRRSGRRGVGRNVRMA